MTAKKSLKRRVRARMEKTGERYTAARRRVTSPSEDGSTSPQTEAVTALPDAISVAAIAETRLTESLVVETSSGAPTAATVYHPGTSDAAVRRATGRGWDEWLPLIDAWGGASKTHPEIAAYLSEVHGVDGWWAQSVTVGYERARGMRAPGQLTDGYATNASKTIAVPLERLYQAFADPKERERWLSNAPLTVTTANPGKAVRGAWEIATTEGTSGTKGTNTTSRVDVGFTTKGPNKSQVAIQHRRLPDATTAGEMKEYWRERLAVLEALLTAAA